MRALECQLSEGQELDDTLRTPLIKCYNSGPALVACIHFGTVRSSKIVIPHNIVVLMS
jgi:hypothetical protein